MQEIGLESIIFIIKNIYLKFLTTSPKLYLMTTSVKILDAKKDYQV